MSITAEPSWLTFPKVRAGPAFVAVGTGSVKPPASYSLFEFNVFVVVSVFFDVSATKEPFPNLALAQFNRHYGIFPRQN
jgi:hypothetical protein